MKLFSIVLVAVLLGACATTGTEMSSSNDKIQTPHYSFVVQPNQSWRFSVRPDHPDKSRMDIRDLEKRQGSGVYSIRVMRRKIPESLRNLSNEEIADDYLANEISVMKFRELALAGRATFEDFLQGEDVIGASRFFTMSYRATFTEGDESLRTNIYFFLLFPKDKHNDWFLFSSYAEGCKRLGDLATYSRKAEWSSPRAAVIS